MKVSIPCMPLSYTFGSIVPILSITSVISSNEAEIAKIPTPADFDFLPTSDMPIMNAPKKRRSSPSINILA